MADMYHNSDPKIESATHKIRKKFRDTMNEIEYHGQGIHSVEAFLINTEDMDKLRMLFHNGSQVPGAGIDEEGQVKMYGVKIIESEYVPEGTIFKVFKNDQQQPFLSPNAQISGSISYPMAHNGSGVIPGWPLSKDQIEDSMSPMTTSIDAEEVTTKQITENMKKAIEAVDKVLDEPVPQGHVPQDEERHSTKRRIELEE